LLFIVVPDTVSNVGSAPLLARKNLPSLEPSLIQTTGTNYYFLAQANTIHNFTEFEALSHVGKHASGIYPKTSQISVTQGQAGGISTVNAAAKILLSAEL